MIRSLFKWFGESSEFTKYAVLFAGCLLWDALFGKSKGGSAASKSVGAGSLLPNKIPKEGSMSETKHGIKETKEVLTAANTVSLFIIERVKDGVGMDDAMAVVNKMINDGAFKKILADAVENIKSVPDEIKDLDLNEGLELGMYQAMQVPKFVEALKK